MFFVDDTGHEEFADPNYLVFGLGGCVMMAGALEAVIKRPWRALKEQHFGGADQAHPHPPAFGGAEPEAGKIRPVQRVGARHLHLQGFVCPQVAFGQSPRSGSGPV